ncbi:MAG TPA: sigma-70 family RNA polymerase sigma factor [Micromonosporaceae bacterium]
MVRLQRSIDAADDLSAALASARRGQDAGFLALYRAVQPGLLRYLAALVGPDAEDVASEAWLHVVRDLRTFRGDGAGFAAWAAAVARHRAIDHLRQYRRRPVPAVPVEALIELADRADTAEQALAVISTDDAVALISTLPRREAEAVLLRVVVGLDAESAARVLGTHAGAVRTAAYRGLRRLASRVRRSSS